MSTYGQLITDAVRELSVLEYSDAALEAKELLGKALGVDCRIVYGQEDWTEHCWNIVRIDGSYYHVDISAAIEDGAEAGSAAELIGDPVAVADIGNVRENIKQHALELRKLLLCERDRFSAVNMFECVNRGK